VRWHAHEDRDISPGCAVRPRSSRANGGAAAQVRRHLTLVCPQKPGLIKSITDLLKDHACTLIEVETSTFQKSGEIMFELSCLVDCPTSADAAELHSMIVWWTESQGNRLEWSFNDNWQQHRVNAI